MKKRLFFKIMIFFIIFSMFCFYSFANTGPKPKRIRVLSTGYCPCSICCGEYANGITSTGRDAKLPGVAVDPKRIPYGTRVDIPNYNARGNKWGGNGSWILVDDTGGAMRQSSRKGITHIDIRFRTHEEAKQWGRKYIYITVWIH